MKLLLAILLTTSCIATPTKTPRLRALWNLEEVARCKLHHSAIVYNNYGCWCGVGGAHTPVDGIDECCRRHDKCYDAAVDDGQCYDVEEEYVDPYKWTCDNSTPTCDGTNSGCGAALCRCDLAVAECWSQYPKPTFKPKCNNIDLWRTPNGNFSL